MQISWAENSFWLNSSSPEGHMLMRLLGTGKFLSSQELPSVTVSVFTELFTGQSAKRNDPAL